MYLRTNSKAVLIIFSVNKYELCFKIFNVESQI